MLFRSAQSQKIVQISRLLMASSDDLVFDDVVKEMAFTLKDANTTTEIDAGNVVLALKDRNSSIDVPASVITFTDNFAREIDDKIASTNELTQLPLFQNTLDSFLSRATMKITKADANMTGELNNLLNTLNTINKTQIIEFAEAPKPVILGKRA